METLTDAERHDFAREIAVIARRWRVRLDERLVGLDMSQARWVALYWLSQEPEGISQTALAERTAVEAPTLTRVIDQLESQELVKRTCSPTDRRVNLLTLSERALPLVNEINHIAEGLRQEVMADVTLEEFKMAMSVLRRMRTRLDRPATSSSQAA
jgi:MarR family transcriptional regulator for hemolysin